MRGFGTICLFIVLAFIPGSPVAAQQTLTLAEGKRLVLKDITVVTPLITGGEKTLRADVSVSGEERRSRKQLSVFADEFFMFYFGVYAERKGFNTNLH